MRACAHACMRACVCACVHAPLHLLLRLHSHCCGRHGFWVYDFALPLLVLHALRFKTAEPLKNWLSICPRRQVRAGAACVAGAGTAAHLGRAQARPRTLLARVVSCGCASR